MRKENLIVTLFNTTDVAWTILMMSLLPFCAKLIVVVPLLYMKGQRALGFK